MFVQPASLRSVGVAGWEFVCAHWQIGGSAVTWKHTSLRSSWSLPGSVNVGQTSKHLFLRIAWKPVFFRFEISQLQLCKTLYWPNKTKTHFYRPALGEELPSCDLTLGRWVRTLCRLVKSVKQRVWEFLRQMPCLGNYVGDLEIPCLCLFLGSQSTALTQLMPFFPETGSAVSLRGSSSLCLAGFPFLPKSGNVGKPRV